MELPAEFTKEMRELLGGEYSAWMESMEKGEAETGSFRGLRVNTLKAEPEELRKRLPFSLRPIPWTGNGFYIEGGERASRHPYYAAGLYYLQEPSAMVPAAALPIEEGDRVLDLCAAPGGKATELAARLCGTGLLAANDISNSRAKALLKNLELFGAENILVTSESPERLCSYFEGFFDKILIDAPCSGEGMFRKEPSMVKDWKEKGPLFYAGLQKEIVSQAARLLRPGGLLLYSTCTFSVRENEETILSLLRSEPGFRVLPLALEEEAAAYGFAPGLPDLVSAEAAPEGLSEEEQEQLRLAARLYPHRIGGEGHFAALLQKKGEREPEALSAEKRAGASPENRKKKGKNGKSGKFGSTGQEHEKNEKLPEGWEEFSRFLRCPIDESRIRLYDGRLYLLPEELLNQNIRGLRFLRTGLFLGEVKGKRFEPSQALAMALGREEFSEVLDFSPEDERVKRYLKGETLDVEDLPGAAAGKGWRLVCVDGFPLGWGKLAAGSLKNKYYPGWRW